MTLEEFQKWIGDSTLETTIGSISESDAMYNPKRLGNI